ncbi:hypothetical protein ABK040_004986 [Willaertia magna]
MVVVKKAFSLNHPDTDDVCECITELFVNNNNKQEEITTMKSSKFRQHIFINPNILSEFLTLNNFKFISKSRIIERYLDTRDSYYRKKNIWLKMAEVYDENDVFIEDCYSIRTIEKGQQNSLTTLIKEEKFTREEFLERPETLNIYRLCTFDVQRTRYERNDNMILYVDEVKSVEFKDFYYIVCTIETDLEQLNAMLNWKKEIYELTFARSKVVKFMSLYDDKVYTELEKKNYIGRHWCYFDEI